MHRLSLVVMPGLRCCAILQTVTTAARDAVHRVSEGMSAAGNAAANAAGTLVDKAKEVVQVGPRGAVPEGRGCLLH